MPERFGGGHDAPSQDTLRIQAKIHRLQRRCLARLGDSSHSVRSQLPLDASEHALMTVAAGLNLDDSFVLLGILTQELAHDERIEQVTKNGLDVGDGSNLDTDVAKGMPSRGHVNRPVTITRKTGTDPDTRTMTSRQQSTSLGHLFMRGPETAAVVMFDMPIVASFPLPAAEFRQSPPPCIER